MKQKYFGLFLMGVFFFFLFHIVNEKEGMQVMSKVSYETLNIALQSGLFKEEYKDWYKEIKYQEEENFIQNVNTFLNLSYTPEEINEIYAHLTLKNIEKLSTMEKQDLKAYYTIPNFEVDKIERYEAFKEQKGVTLRDAVLQVNIGLDRDFYTEIESISDPSSYLVLVNKYHSLGEYEPSDLKSLSYDEKYQLREVARDAFESMVSGAVLDGVYLRPYSAYRSYQYQTGLYNTYVNRDGQLLADTYSARPGHSEHQTGLAVDVWSTSVNEITEHDAAWLKENSYHYGFIVRYQKDTEKITGYIEEPWHLRYVGVEVANDVVTKGLTFDEYYDLYLK